MTKTQTLKTLAAAVALGGFAAAANAQVAGSFDSMVDSIATDNLAAEFTGVAVNTDVATISGDITIQMTGSNGLQDIDTSNVTNQSITGGNTLEDTTITDLSEITAATTSAFGDVASVAAGAINEATLDLTQTGSSVVNNAAANTSDTSSTTDSTTLAGSAIGAVTGAFNSASITGDVAVTITGGNVTGGAIGTTAAGAINTSAITAAFVGTGATD